VTSDDMEMRAISSQYGLEESVPAAIEAGIDVLCFGNNQSYDPDIAPKAIDILVRAVTSGRIPESRIDESVHRIQSLKRRMGVKP
jgi:beta-N-acetylhexosaminidase